jgi:hypothetical protein
MFLELNVTTRGTVGKGRKLDSADRGQLSQPDAEEFTGIKHQQVSKCAKGIAKRDQIATSSTATPSARRRSPTQASGLDHLGGQGRSASKGDAKVL